MSMLLQLIKLTKSLMPHITPHQQHDEAYLSESADIYDLEHRMRELDQRSRLDAHGLAYRLHLS
nr:DUF3563 family protein [uncultured Rhodoferax sp.]